MINNIDKSSLSKSGIYIVTNTINSKKYIGSAELFSRRRSQHLHRLKKGTHQSRHMQSHFNKYGAESLIFSVLELCSHDVIIEREQYYLDKYDPFVDNGFNTVRIAGVTVGYKHTEETKIKMRVPKRNPVSDEVREVRRISSLGRKHTPETFVKMFKAQANKTYGEEARRNMSLAKKGKKLSEKQLAGFKNRKNNPNKNVIVFNTETGIFYSTVKEASETYPRFGLAAFYKRISGSYANNTAFIKA